MFAAVAVVVHVDLAVAVVAVAAVAAAFADAVDAAVVVHVADSLRMLSTKSLPFWFGDRCLYRLLIAPRFCVPLTEGTW